MRAAATTSPLFAALRLFSDGSLPRSTNRLEGGGSRPHTPAFRCVRLVLQTASYREQRSAWQAGAAAPTLKLPAALGLSFRRNAIAGNETLGRWGLSPHTPPPLAALGLSRRQIATAGSETLGRWGLPRPHPRFSLRSACLADGSLSRATNCLAGVGCRPHIPAFRCARLVLQTIRYRGQRNAWQVGAAAPTPPLFAAFG
jgi:hypothetical protein